ncbi:hypothetical protein [Francisella philomiragia]|uniref:LA2681-like HEPN domain-containing protein n=1 Tax=Francisella philomiragia TaxID=28110 RepID=A0ABS1GEM3_9GAMM|nr:hypothetical protein [Francisella philomiragia]MBK2259563.1 hypothetical protein [Francisella philomiragia]MBK2303255.1 hypothetical protein [Francisella philomiragia]
MLEIQIEEVTGFSFDYYKECYKNLYSFMKSNDIFDYQILKYLFSFAYANAGAYLEMNILGTKTYRQLNKNDKNACLLHYHKHFFNNYMISSEKFLLWYKENMDRFDIKHTGFFDIHFDHYINIICLLNIMKDVADDYTWDIGKLLSSFHGYHKCLKAEKDIYLSNKKHNIFEYFYISLDLFRDNNENLRLIDISKYNNSYNIANIQQMIFTRWQAFCCMSDIVIEVEGLLAEEVIDGCMSVTRNHLIEKLSLLKEFICKLYEDPITARFEWFMDKVNHTQDPLGKTDSIKIRDGRIDKSNPYTRILFYKCLYGTPHKILEGEYKEKVSELEIFKNNKSVETVYFTEFFKDKRDCNKLITDSKELDKSIKDFWLEDNYLYVLDLILLEKILSIKLPHRSLSKYIDYDENFSTYEHRVKARLNNSYITWLSLAEALAELESNKSHGVTTK